MNKNNSEERSIGPCYTLSNGVMLPCMGYGTYKTAEGKDAQVIEAAIKAGYRYLDTASLYGTETFVGQAIWQSGLPREAFFIASKVWKEEMGYAETKEAFQRSLEALGTDYLDVYLIHWPRPSLIAPDWRTIVRETWRAMEELYLEGKIRAIGVSNFLPHHLESLLETATIKPMINQIEFHPGYTQEATVAYCQARDILVQAWSPIGRGRVLQDELITELAQQYKVTPAQLCLRFALQKQIMPLPKSSSIERMKQNQELFSFEISQSDRYRLETMPQTGWSGEHPDREWVKI